MSTDIEQMVAEARELVASWDLKGSWSSDSPVGMVMRLADALEREHWRAEEAEAAIREALAGLRASAEPDWPGWDALAGTERILSRALDTEKGDG